MMVGKIRRWYVWLLLVASMGWLVLPLPQLAAAQQAMNYEAYLQTIAQFRSRALSAGNDPQACLQTMNAIADELEQISLVAMPDGQTMAVDHRAAADALRLFPCTPGRADQYLSGLCPDQLCPVSRPVPPLRPSGSQNDEDSLVGAGQPANQPAMSEQPPMAGTGENTPAPPNLGSDPMGNSSGPENIREPSENAGDSPENNGEPADNGREPVGFATPGGLATMEANSTTLPTNPTPTPVPATAVPPADEDKKISPWLVGLVGLAIVLIGTAVVLLFWSGKNEPEKPPVTKPPTAAGTALNEGRQLVEKGDYRQAVRRLFLAMLLTLDEQGAVRFDRALTNFELLQEGQARPLLQPTLAPLAPIITSYERVWYGLEPLPAAEYDLLVKQIEEMRDWKLKSEQ